MKEIASPVVSPLFLYREHRDSIATMCSNGAYLIKSSKHPFCININVPTATALIDVVDVL